MSQIELERWANEVLTLDTRVALAEIVRDHRISDRHLIPICRIVGRLADDGWSVEMICSALSSEYDYSKIRRMQND